MIDILPRLHRARLVLEAASDILLRRRKLRLPPGRRHSARPRLAEQRPQVVTQERRDHRIARRRDPVRI